jgi:hypothetical protein
MAMGRPKSTLVLDSELREQLESLANSRSLRASAGDGESLICGWEFARPLLPFSFGAVPTLRLFEMRSVRRQDGCRVWPGSVWPGAVRLPNETRARHLRE